MRRWMRICFFNLFLVSLVGVILRYKIAFSLPIVDQKHLLHGHSHFAFGGWISQALMVLMVNQLAHFKPAVFRSYHWLLMANLVTAFGMLLSFPVQGYGLVSICFSTLSILVSWAFAIRYWIDLNRYCRGTQTAYWLKAALLFNAISALGAFALAGMMANKIVHANWYLAAQYYFLHFQYNGWFFFAIMGLFVARIEEEVSSTKILRFIFWLFALACVPAYFLSALWMPIPLIVYVLVVMAALMQCLAWVLLLFQLRKNREILREQFSMLSRRILFLSGLAFSVKLLLQMGSTHPALSKLAFGFRPIVIGYLHLVLLGVISLFIIGYSLSAADWRTGKLLKAGVWGFVGGIIINELLLMAQGITGFSYIAVPHGDDWLLGAALLMCSSLLLFNFSIRLRPAPEK